MLRKIGLSTLAFVFSLELLAQGKIFVEPYAGFFVGLSKGNNDINRNQTIITNNYFGGKDLAIGGKLTYKKAKSTIGLGYETSFYTSSLKHIENGFFPKVNSYYSQSSTYMNSVYIEYGKQVKDFNVRMPKFLRRLTNGSEEKLYLISSKLSTVLGVECRFVGRTFVNDFNFNTAQIFTSQGDYVTDIEYLHLNAKANITMRGGLNWEFYNGDKHKFTFILLYKFAFRDAGYFQYRFKSVNNVNPSFDYQTTTRGNGFCIYFSIPIKLYTFKKK